jgi:hypothetical protein
VLGQDYNWIEEANLEKGVLDLEAVDLGGHLLGLGLVHGHYGPHVIRNFA